MVDCRNNNPHVHVDLVLSISLAIFFVDFSLNVLRRKNFMMLRTGLVSMLIVRLIWCAIFSLAVLIFFIWLMFVCFLGQKKCEICTALQNKYCYTMGKMWWINFWVLFLSLPLQSGEVLKEITFCLLLAFGFAFLHCKFWDTLLKPHPKNKSPQMCFIISFSTFPMCLALIVFGEWILSQQNSVPKIWMGWWPRILAMTQAPAMGPRQCASAGDGRAMPLGATPAHCPPPINSSTVGFEPTANETAQNDG